MVKIDFEKLEEEARKEHERWFKARNRCMKAESHLGAQVATGVVDLIDWQREYKCTSCGWLYYIEMTPKEIRDYEEEMNKVVVK